MLDRPQDIDGKVARCVDARSRVSVARRFNRLVPRVAQAFTAVVILPLVVVTPVAGQLEPHDIVCIEAFNKSLRKVAKKHAQIVKKCMSRFAAGKLIGTTPEQCIANDPTGKLLRTVTLEGNKIASLCSGGLPDFGVSPFEEALTRAVVLQFGLVHGSIGPDLNVNLLSDPEDATCQAKITTAFLKCEDTRLKEYLKCQKQALRDENLDGAALAAQCLGTGLSVQPDLKGRIAKRCVSKMQSAFFSHCGETDLAQAFAACGSGDAATTVSCLSSESACQLCRLLNDAGGLVRDCDAFDDGVDNGSCDAECGDGLIHPTETCDDGNAAGEDGCSDNCFEEFGYTCVGEPSTCSLDCGNGALDFGEDCDDGGTSGGDGCSALCSEESGYTCTGEPSICVPSCGNGDIQASLGETCDDGDTSSGDGCSSTCQLEPGWQCNGNPSVCTFVCGNSAFDDGETCDDGDATGGDGCSALCQIESGWLCSGLPSVCGPVCGDGLKRSIESCDDGNMNSGDGCNSLCQTETGFNCFGEPSGCTAICGDGFIRGNENCDDDNTVNGDGCSGTLCRIEFNHFCSGQPSVCDLQCGNGLLDGIEECDDGDNQSGDGCQANCTTQPGFACFGTPSTCFPTCGNSIVDAGETCDDGNALGTDGCSPSCNSEPGWLCTTPGASCQKFDIFIDTPLHGTFTTGTTQAITGHYTTLPSGQVQVLVNGVPATTLNQGARTFSHTVPLNATNVFNPVLVRLIHTVSGQEARDRIVVIRGQSVADGDFSPQAVGLRISDRGLNAVEPVVGDLAKGQFNLATILPPGTVMSDGCVATIEPAGWCVASAKVTVSTPAPTFGNLSIGLDSFNNQVFADIDVSDLELMINVEGSGLAPSCRMSMTADNLQLTGNYALSPDADDPSTIDVNLLGAGLEVDFSGFDTDGCPSNVADKAESNAVDGIKGFLNDPDGDGPEDSPIAQGIEDALSGISISGPVSQGVGLTLDSPMFAVNEDLDGMTINANARFLTSFGPGPGQCNPPFGTPELARSYAPTSTFPSFAPNSPVLNRPYGMAIAISSAAFNQLLRGQTECGLMRASIEDIDLDGDGPGGSLSLTSSLFSFLMPEFGQLPPNTPLRVDVAPTLAPIITGNPGPNNEVATLKIAQFELQVVEPGLESDIVWLAGTLDMTVGLGLSFSGSGLGVSLSAPTTANLNVAILTNPLGVNETDVETQVLPSLIAPLVPSLAGALSGFPLPSFLDLSIQGVEVSRSGQFMVLYADLVGN